MGLLQTAQSNVDVGASKAAKGLLGSLDRRLIEPAGTLVRYSGWVLFLCITYMTFFGTFDEFEKRSIYIWLTLYAGYLLVLELFRHFLNRFYDTQQLRSVRVILNIVIISFLMSFAPAERYFLIIAYTVPIFATVIYFSERNWVKVFVFLLSLVGLFVGGVIFAEGDRLTPVQFLTYSIVLAVLSYGFEIFRKRVHLVPSRLTEIARELHKTLDLQHLMNDILKVSVEITQAQRGIIIIINPRTKVYVGHALFNFKLKENCSIEGLAKRCFVLVYEQAFESPDLMAAYNDKSIYHEFFDSQPRSVIAEPLYNRAGQVMGMINVAHDDANGLGKISKNLLREFAYLVSNAIENCFEHREVILSQARSREAGEKFVSAESEDEAIDILIDELRQQIPHAEKVTLHKFLPKDNSLLPIHSITPEATSRYRVWTGKKPKGLMPDLKLGYGIAGHALELRDTILAPDVDHHPWFVKLDPNQDIKSLLVAPLFDPDDNECYGTISLESSKRSAFDLDDESTLTYLATQASRAIAKVRDFQVWREQGGTLRKILEQVDSFDISSAENIICEQIAEAAARLLGFKIARIRMLSKEDRLVTVAIAGVSEKTKRRLIGTGFPYADLSPFLRKNIKAESSYLIKHGTKGWNRFVDKNFYKPRRVAQKRSGWDVYDALITPLVDSSGNTIGILSLDVPITGSEPNKQILELIGVFANSASWVIELGRVQRRLQEQQYRAQSFIDTISQELARGRDLPAISEVVVQAGAKLLSAEGCSLYLVRGNFIELTHSNYLMNTSYITRRKPISSQPKSGLTAWVAATGELLCYNNEEYKKHAAWAGERDHLAHLPSRTCRSVLVAPIKASDGKVIGVITLENKKTLAGPKDFDDEDKKRLVSLASEFARALDTIGLYEDIKEWERIELADDLHDLINWYHSGVVMWIEALQGWFERGDTERTRQLLPELRQHAYTTVVELKTLHTNMLNKSLESSSLSQALYETMQAWKQRVTPKYKEDMRINFECPERLSIPIGLRNTLVRIASLAFSNALQHSGIIENPAVQVTVRVQQEDNDILLEVVDTGIGIDLAANKGGYGFDRMRQLAEKINNWGGVKSDLEILSEIDRGTKVALRLKLNYQKSPSK